MHSEWSKTDFKQNSTCEWCTTLIFYPIVNLHINNHCPKSQSCSLFGSILKNFYFPQYFPIHSERSKTDFKQNSTYEWCTTLIFWPIVYLHMTNHCPKRQGCTPPKSILKIFYFPQYFNIPSEWSKRDFKQNSTCQWCTTLIFWPIVYPHMTNHCPKSQNSTPFGSILKNFTFPQYFNIHSEWSKTDFKQNSTCEWCPTLVLWPIVYLHMTNHCPKSQGCTPSGSILKNFYFSTIQVPMYTEWSKTEF